MPGTCSCPHLPARHMQPAMLTRTTDIFAMAGTRWNVLVAAVTVLLFLGNGVSANDARDSRFVCPRYIYAFGDSLTDTGNAHAEDPSVTATTGYPYGLSYKFADRPCERTRFCDGRLILDYTAQAFGFPFLEPYSRRFEDSAYSHGVNFALAGATALFTPVRHPTFFLEREVTNYFDFRAGHTGDVDVSTALHMIPEIGGNDFTYVFEDGVSPEEANAQLSDRVLGAIKQNVERLYAGGAKFFYIFNQPPAGCTPYYLTLFSHESPKDEFGCLSAYNAVFQNFNVKLKAAVETYRSMWPDTVILHFDWYAGVYEVIQNPAKYGIEVAGFRACCGGGGPYNFNPLKNCGPLETVCSVSPRTVFWDGVHYTEAFNRVMASFALSGRFVDGPPEAANLTAACNLNFRSFDLTIPNPPGGSHCPGHPAPLPRGVDPTPSHGHSGN